MKRFLTLLAAILMVMTAMAQSSGIVLSYNKGKELKFYTAEKLANAINDAEVNDTIYFGPGVYYLDTLPKYDEYYRQINKPLVFIGSGAQAGGTMLSWQANIYINFDPSLDESKKSISFEGISFNDDYFIRPASYIKDLKFVNVQCKYADYDAVTSSQPVIDNLTIDRCLMKTLDLRQYKTKHVNVNNSKISTLYGGSDNSSKAAFNHCYIEIVSEDFVGIIEHSLIKGISAAHQAHLENCCWYTDGGRDFSTSECTHISNSKVSELDNNPFTLGNCNDGTPYGTLGGQTPYTLYPQYPTPDTSCDPDTNKSKSYVDYDSLNKKLTITVKRMGE